MRSSPSHFIFCFLVARCSHCFLVLVFLFSLFWLVFVVFSLWSFLFYVIFFTFESLACGYHFEYVKDSYTNVQSSIFFFACLISIPLCQFGFLNPPFFSCCYLNLFLYMLNIHYYFAIANIFLLLRFIMPCS